MCSAILYLNKNPGCISPGASWIVWIRTKCRRSLWVKEKALVSSKWNSWILCAPALCGAATRCLSLSRPHCPGTCTAEASGSCWTGPTWTQVPSRGKWAGRGVIEGCRLTFGTDPWSWVAALHRGYTETGTAPWPAGGPETGGAAAETRASPRWPSGRRWRGRSRDCRPWPLLLRWTGTGRGASAAESPETGTRWWSSCASSTWHVDSETRPADRQEMS